MFLEKTELKTVGVDEIINKIINNDDKIVTDIIEEDIDLASSYLFQYYDVETIFSATGDDRNKTLLRHLKGLVIFDIYTRRSMAINEVTKLRYDEAMLWLEKVSTGKIKPDLPPKQIDTDGDGNPDSPATFLKLGSRKNYQNGW
ncbi:phage protein Gp36 family protein [uncultured Flavobacterium sp.]|uniref:phage protein Gp36 family protein n=1 Tax=uncultured Flavobacterium sp. TaxID=165435 RepID=UPI0025EF5170|nr:phage protein Gp36 family protein [uncultured Flavobacterium sp.]